MKKVLIICILGLLIFSCNFDPPIVDINDEEPGDTAFVLVDHILEEYEIISLAFGPDNEIWFSTTNKELIYCGSGDTIIYNSSNSIIEDLRALHCIVVDSQGKVWFKNDDLMSYDKGTFKRYTPENSQLPLQDVSTFEVDSQDRLWLISYHYHLGGLVCIDGDDWTFYNHENTAMKTCFLASLAIDSQDKLWVAPMDFVDGIRLTSYDQNNWELYTVPDIECAINYFSNIYIDRFDNVFGTLFQNRTSMDFTNLRGIFKYDVQANTCEFLNGSTPMLHASRYKNHYFDNDNRLWASARSEMYIFDGVDWCGVDTISNESSLNIRKFTNAPDGDLWVVTNEGVFIYRETVE